MALGSQNSSFETTAFLLKWGIAPMASGSRPLWSPRSRAPPAQPYLPNVFCVFLQRRSRRSLWNDFSPEKAQNYLAINKKGSIVFSISAICRMCENVLQSISLFYSGIKRCAKRFAHGMPWSSGGLKADLGQLAGVGHGGGGGRGGLERLQTAVLSAAWSSKDKGGGLVQCQSIIDIMNGHELYHQRTRLSLSIGNIIYLILFLKSGIRIITNSDDIFCSTSEL